MMALLREHSFLFIGTALRDDNLRRLLHYNYQERVAAAERRKRTKRPRRWLRHFLLTCRSSNPSVDEATQLAHERIGVRTIWLNQWDELPTFLGDLYKEDGCDWGSVY
jgi:hypothetical protein